MGGDSENHYYKAALFTDVRSYICWSIVGSAGIRSDLGYCHRYCTVPGIVLGNVGEGGLLGRRN